MPATLTYVIEFVADMDRAVKFYRDIVRLPLKFQSSEWSEFSTGIHSLRWGQDKAIQYFAEATGKPPRSQPTRSSLR